MTKQLLEAGKIINTHGIRGELKVQPWCDSLEIFLSLKRLYLDQTEYRVVSSRPHKGNALVILQGIDRLDLAESLKNKTVYLNREDIPLSENTAFIHDMIGLPVFDRRTQQEIGLFKEMLHLPAGDIMLIRQDSRQYMIPAVETFLKKIDLKNHLIEVSTIEGMLDDEN